MNLGNAVAATPTTAGIYISTDATITTSDTLLTTMSTSATLATVSQPGHYDHQTVTVALPGNLAPGTYYVGGLADYNNHLTESNETNNAYNVTQIAVAAASSPAAQTTAMGDNFAPAQTDTGQAGGDSHWGGPCTARFGTRDQCSAAGGHDGYPFRVRPRIQRRAASHQRLSPDLIDTRSYRSSGFSRARALV